MDRRQFMKLSAGTLAGLSAGFLISAPGCAQAARSTLPRFDYGGQGAGQDAILLAYASRCGSTTEVASTIGRVLNEQGAAVHVRPLEDLDDVSSYRAVVIGSAIRMGKWLPEASDFVKAHYGRLARIPVACFMTCLTMREPTQDNRQKAMAYLKPLLEDLPEFKPRSIGLFAGALDYGKVSWALGAVLKAKGLPEGDFRDWEAIRAWSAQVGPALGAGRVNESKINKN
ncbi:MAG: flavodoxin domain-containing protein [Proteobacteria bacterium]|nr:flavodoxin domain-containing protein [Pseudomonadota bacterium]